MAESYQNTGSVVRADTIYGNPSVVTHFHEYRNSEPKSIYFQVDVSDINFVGRSPELHSLKIATTNNDQKPQIIIVVFGLGGIGKTQLVRKFIHQNRSSYEHVVWIGSDARGQIEENFKTLAEELNIPTQYRGRKREFKCIAQEVFNKLSTKSTLMVFDNVDEKKNCDFVFRMGTLGDKPHVIITSRIQEWSDSVHLIKLEVFETAEAVEYVSRTLINPDKNYNDSAEDKKELAEKLQNFPLALKQATAHINHQRKVTKFHIADYINNYNTQELLDSTHFLNDSCNTYAQTTFKTWRVTIDAINQNGATGNLALRILNIIAFFNPDRIRRDIFCNLTLPFSPKEKRKKLEIEGSVRSAVRLLVNYSMVDSKENQSVLSIHRLVQQVIKIDLENTRGRTKTTVILRDGLLLAEKYENFQEIYEHAIQVFVSALTFSELVIEFRTFPNMILQRLNDCWKYYRAIDFGYEILHHLTTIFGEDDRNTLNCKFSVACSYNYLGKNSKALQMFEEIFEKERQILGNDHLDTLKRQFSVAYSYRELGRHCKALQMFEEVFEKQKQILGIDHPDTLRSQSNIACSYSKLGKHSRALQMFEQVFEKQKQILGNDHIETLKCQNNIGYSYSELGKHSKALQIFEAVFEKQKQIIGQDHPETLKCHSNIAYSYSELGEHPQALQMFEAIFEKQKQILGNGHQETLKCQFSVAYSYRELGEHPKSLKMFEEVFKKQIQTLGIDHPGTLITKSNIAYSYRELGQHFKALQMFEEVFEKQKQILGIDHPGTLKSQSHIAYSHREMGQHFKALQMFEEVFEKRKQIFGNDHPDALNSQSHIADLYRELGEYTRALQIFEEIFEKQKQILGNNHPQTLITMSNIANMLTYL